MGTIRSQIPKRILTALLCALILLCAVCPMAAGAQQTKVVRVGYVWSTNFAEGESDEEYKSGYAYEYLQKVAYYTGWEYQYVYGDWSNIFQMLVDGQVDLMIGVATPVAMAMQAATENSGIPVVFSAVSDPVSAGLVEALDKPGENITGTSDFLDATAVMNLMFAANPEIQKVGLLYDVGQDSSKTAIETAKSYLQSKGVTVVEKTGRTNDELIQAAQNLVAEKVEAIFTPTDNTVMKAELAIYEILADAKIPHYTGADSFALNGAFLGYGVDYANLGKETANMVCEILVDKKPVSSMNVRTFDNGTATINTEICEKLGYNFEELKTIFAPYCTKVQSITTAEEFEK